MCAPLISDIVNSSYLGLCISGSNIKCFQDKPIKKFMSSMAKSIIEYSLNNPFLNSGQWLIPVLTISNIFVS